MPQRTIQLLDQLEALGFTDDDFAIVHHSASGETIHGMRVYCEQTTQFQQGGTNEKVRERLEFVLAAFKGGRYGHPARAGVFEHICEAAVRQIPFKR